MGKGTAARVQRHRAQLRSAGLRPLQIWVPDTRQPGFAEECRQQSRRLKDDLAEQDALGWLDEVRDTDGWT